ncbi:hypothetical protein MAPG_04536 [Magnaporthiopsis poae ATCC 64411]|uniref:Uncharacterized protein n=1 Tax=Magnaporthiopsis poae (strain ATCC 64411 / 73-15) TaxID=644358 RepID=A0A0C4DX01_MAGP6|nr:hypothetical protein MAPG_04536 [Magnaporthiopsis poae ATCC 64411]
MSHFGSIEPAAAAPDPKGRQGPCPGYSFAEGLWPPTEANKVRSATPNNHSAARPEAGSWTPWPRVVDAGKARAGSGGGSGGQMPQQKSVEGNNSNKRHTRIWDCFHVDVEVDTSAAAPRRNNLHLSAPLSSRNRTSPSQQGEEENDSGVWDELDVFLAELELAQQLGSKKATRTKKVIPTGGRAAFEEMAFF